MQCHLIRASFVFASLLGAASFVFACGGSNDDGQATPVETAHDGGAPPKGAAPTCGPITGLTGRADTVIGPNRSRPSDLLALPDAVLWCEDNLGTTVAQGIARWDRRTGKISQFAAESCSTLVADDAAVYWGDHARTIGRASRDGSQPTILHSPQGPEGSDPSEGWNHLAVDDSHVYWSDSTSWGGVYAVPKVGGESVMLDPANFPSGIAVDDTYVWWGAGGGIARWSKQTESRDLFTHEGSEGLIGARNLQLAGDYVYWISKTGLERTPKSGAAAEHLYTSEAGEPVQSISIQAGCLYFNAGTGLYRMPLEGGGASRLTTSRYELPITSYAADEYGVYWEESEWGEAGSVYMLAENP